MAGWPLAGVPPGVEHGSHAVCARAGEERERGVRRHRRQVEQPDETDGGALGDAGPELLDDANVQHSLAGEVRDERALAVGPDERHGDRSREVVGRHDRADVDPARGELVADPGALEVVAHDSDDLRLAAEAAQAEREVCRLPGGDARVPGSHRLLAPARKRRHLVDDQVGREIPDDADAPGRHAAITAMLRHR